MSRGYWGANPATCRCCNSGPKSKFVCISCDHVTKAPVSGSGVPHCPYCREPMTGMGHRARPGKKGKRNRRSTWIALDVLRQRWRTPKPGEDLLARIGPARRGTGARDRDQNC